MTSRLLFTLAAIGCFQASAYAQEAVRGVTDTEIVLGSHTDMSGPAAAYGIGAVNGVQLGMDEINAKGGIHGRKLRLVVEDTQYQVPRAVQAGNKLINRDNVFAIIVGIGTPMNNAVFPMQEKANIPNLFPNSQARVMWSPLHRLKFQFNADYQDQGSIAMKFFKDRGRKTFCTEYQDTDYGKDIVLGAEEQLKKLGLTFAARQAHKPTDTDLGTQIINLRKANCDVVLLATLGRDSVIAYSTARRLGWDDVDFVGISATYDPSVSSATGTDGLYAVTPTFVPAGEKLPAAGRAWFETYKAKFGTEANPAAMNGYNGMVLTGMALDKAGKDLTVDKFIAAMESIRDYKDIFGNAPQNYSPEKHQGSNSAYVVRVKSGGFELAGGPFSAD